MAELVVGPKRQDIFSLVDVPALKLAKRITNAREDEFIRDCILDAWSAIDGPEGVCRRAVLPQTWRFIAGGWPRYGWRFPVGTPSEIVSLKYWPATGPQVELDTANFYLDQHGDRIGGDLRFLSTYAYPALTDRFDAIEVVYKAGFADVASVPRVFRRALLLLAGHFYENREATFSDNKVTVVSRAIDWGIDKLLSKYVIPIDYAGGR